MFTNRTKEKLAAGKVAWGVTFGEPYPVILELLGQCGFDWVLLDNEHGHISVDSMPVCARACEAGGITPIVRPIINKPEWVRPFMDLGAHGVQVPQVDTVEEARAAVDAVKYHPLGKRGFAGVRGSNLSPGEYLAAMNDATLVCLMIESPLGVENAAAIAAVEGVDVVFIGAADLSVLMGYQGQMTHPEVERAAEGAVEAVVRAGKIAGLSCPDDKIPFWLERGVRYFHAGGTGLLSRAGREWLHRMNEAASRLGIEV